MVAQIDGLPLFSVLRGKSLPLIYVRRHSAQGIFAFFRKVDPETLLYRLLSGLSTFFFTFFLKRRKS